MSGTLVYCVKHGGWVVRREATEVRAEETGSGPGRPAYACLECVRTHGLLTISRPPGVLVAPGDTATPGRPS